MLQSVAVIAEQKHIACSRRQRVRKTGPGNGPEMMNVEMRLPSLRRRPPARLAALTLRLDAPDKLQI